MSNPNGQEGEIGMVNFDTFRPDEKGEPIQGIRLPYSVNLLPANGKPLVPVDDLLKNPAQIVQFILDKMGKNGTMTYAEFDKELDAEFAKAEAPQPKPLGIVA